MLQGRAPGRDFVMANLDPQHRPVLYYIYPHLVTFDASRFAARTKEFGQPGPRPFAMTQHCGWAGSGSDDSALRVGRVGGRVR